MSTATTPQRSTVPSNAGKRGDPSPSRPQEGDTAPPKDGKKARENRDPLAPFHKLIHELILKPRLATLVKSHPGKNDVELHEIFRQETGSCVALKRFREWMSSCGFVQAWISK